MKTLKRLNSQSADDRMRLNQNWRADNEHRTIHRRIYKEEPEIPAIFKDLSIGIDGREEGSRETGTMGSKVKSKHCQSLLKQGQMRFWKGIRISSATSLSFIVCHYGHHKVHKQICKEHTRLPAIYPATEGEGDPCLFRERSN